MREEAMITASVPVAATKLEPDAIGVAQDTVIGLASSAPAASLGLTLAAVALATAYASGLVIILCAIPMLIIANAYRRLNLWNANCGASFEWVGRSISPYLGFFTGWLMIAAYVVGTISGVEVLGPSVLAVFGDNASSQWGNIGIATAVTLVMLAIGVIGIKITARTQVGMAFVEYAILVGFAIWGLIAVLGHHHGTYPITKGWFSFSGIGGKGSLTAGFLLAVFMFSGWDGTLYVNEEVRHRRRNPGKAAMIAVLILAFLYAFSSIGLQGVVSPTALQANGGTTALTVTATALGGSGWGKVMALAIALSSVASTGAGIILTARIMYGMANYRTLPPFLGNVSRRFSTPVPASLVVGFLVLALTWVYLLATSVQNAFTDVVDITGLLYCLFYVLTALATITYYRRRLSRPKDMITLGILPLAAAGFLIWIVVKSMMGAPGGELWSMAGVGIVGVVLLVAARVFLRPNFFHMSRESEPAGAADIPD
jgi:amino acid transporter